RGSGIAGRGGHWALVHVKTGQRTLPVSTRRGLRKLILATQAKRLRTIQSARSKFKQACELLAEVTAAGFHVYIAGSGSVHLLSGPRMRGLARRARIASWRLPTYPTPPAGTGKMDKKSRPSRSQWRELAAVRHRNERGLVASPRGSLRFSASAAR